MLKSILIFVISLVICYNSIDQAYFSLVKITELDFLIIPSNYVQYATLNKYFRDVPPMISQPNILDFIDFQLVISNLEFHSSSNIFNSVYDEIKNKSTTKNSSSAFYINPFTHELISDYDFIFDSFDYEKSKLEIDEKEIINAKGETVKQIKIIVKFSLINLEIVYHYPDIHFISFQIIPNEGVRSFQSSFEIYFKNFSKNSTNEYVN